MKKDQIKKICRKLFDFIMLLAIMFYIAPDAKQALFPDKMTRLEKMFRNATMERYQIAVEYSPSYSMVLTIFDGGNSITARIFEHRLIELEPAEGKRIFFAHDVNTDAENYVYLSRAYFETDAELKRLIHLELTMCRSLKTDMAKIRFNGHEPIYECKVPIKKIKASARE